MSKDLDVVLISGRQGSGKSTLAANIRIVIRNQLLDWSVEEHIFAGAIYEMHDACRDILAKYAIQPKGVKDGKLLQFLGTEWGRETYDSEIWVKILQTKVMMARQSALAERLTVLVPDTRFKNELRAFPNAMKVRLECPEHLRKERCSAWRENTNHPSEIDLDDCIGEFDFICDTGTTTSMEIARKIVGELFYGR